LAISNFTDWDELSRLLPDPEMGNMSESIRRDQDMKQDLVAPPKAADALAATNIPFIHVNQGFY
jgi:hypothetical protein